MTITHLNFPSPYQNQNLFKPQHLNKTSLSTQLLLKQPILTRSNANTNILAYLTFKLHRQNPATHNADQEDCPYRPRSGLGSVSPRNSKFSSLTTRPTNNTCRTATTLPIPTDTTTDSVDAQPPARSSSADVDANTTVPDIDIRDEGEDPEHDPNLVKDPRPPRDTTLAKGITLFDFPDCYQRCFRMEDGKASIHMGKVCQKTRLSTLPSIWPLYTCKPQYQASKKNII